MNVKFTRTDATYQVTNNANTRIQIQTTILG